MESGNLRQRRIGGAASLLVEVESLSLRERKAERNSTADYTKKTRMRWKTWMRLRVMSGEAKPETQKNLRPEWRTVEGARIILVEATDLSQLRLPRAW